MVNLLTVEIIIINYDNCNLVKHKYIKKTLYKKQAFITFITSYKISIVFLKHFLNYRTNIYKK